MKAPRFRSIGLGLRTAIAASTLALVATGDGPTTAPARPAGAVAPANVGAGAAPLSNTPSASSTTNATATNSAIDIQRAFNGAADLLRGSARQRPANGNVPPRPQVGNLIDTITLSAAQPVVGGRARLSATSMYIGDSPVWHSMMWDTEKNLLAIKMPAGKGQTEVAINLMRENNRVYVISCAITAPIAECSALATTEGWSKVYPIRHNLPDTVYWVIPAKKDGPAGWVKAALTPSTDGSWVISQCDINTYQAP